MRKIFFDIETNGLDFDDMDVLMVALAVNDEEPRVFLDIEEALKIMDTANLLVGFNIINFDLPVLAQEYNWKPKCEVYDVMIATSLIYRDLYLADTQNHKWRTRVPKKLYGSNSLRAWGYRLEELKGDFSSKHDWELNEETRDDFIDYAKQDIVVTRKVYEYIEPKVAKYKDALELEQEVAKIIARQERYGFLFDVTKARELLGKMYEEVAELDEEFSKIPPKEVVTGEYKRNNAKLGIKKGDPKIRIIPFNPGSRQQVAEYLIETYGWQPKEFTPNNQPKVDETILNSLEYPVAKKIARYLKLKKLIGLLAEGGQAVLKYVAKDGRIHGRVHTLGAVSRRMTHAKPNVAQTPSDHEFRELYTVPKNKKLVGIDASGLELRCLAHYIYPYDGGRYVKEILHGDIHTANQEAAGLATRQQAKRFIYAFLYGAAPMTLAEIAEIPSKEGWKLKESFLKRTPGLEKLMNKVNTAASRGFIKSLDGVPLPIREEYRALNLILQSAGAVLMKRALVIFDRKLQEKGHIPGVHYEFVANVHDEWQLEVDEDIAEEVAQLGVQAIREAGEYYNFRCPLDGEAKIGNNWAETH
jgi:DNA polymerase I-like protein with 3'-5' exonuclease and polymerase domains